MITDLISSGQAKISAEKQRREDEARRGVGTMSDLPESIEVRVKALRALNDPHLNVLMDYFEQELKRGRAGRAIAGIRYAHSHIRPELHVPPVIDDYVQTMTEEQQQAVMDRADEIVSGTRVSMAAPNHSWRATKIGASVIETIDDQETTLAHVNGIGAERRAKAQLIAAAPDLYDALKALRDWCDQNINGVPFEYGQIMERADSALKKANGEQS